MGAERLRQRRIDWKTLPSAAPEPDCRVFAETGHAVCGDILTAWQASGLNIDDDPSISEVQWFERARFELHPENAPPFNVLLGLLGRELGPRASLPPMVVRASAPTRLVIDSIGLDYQVVGVGTDANGDLAVPDHDIGWYTASAAPGGGDNVVFWAHVLRFMNAPGIPAPFERLKELPIGARVTVYDDLGQAHAYAVTQQLTVTPDQVDVIMPVGRERVTMVSCYGANVIVNGAVVDMTHRLITIAEPV